MRYSLVIEVVLLLLLISPWFTSGILIFLFNLLTVFDFNRIFFTITWSLGWILNIFAIFAFLGLSGIWSLIYVSECGFVCLFCCYATIWFMQRCKRHGWQGNFYMIVPVNILFFLIFCFYLFLDPSLKHLVPGLVIEVNTCYICSDGFVLVFILV